MSDDQIIKGFRKGDAEIIRRYFYGYCLLGYHVFDRRYQLSGKENLDFMSLAHQYAICLMDHDWKPLEDHSPEVSQFITFAKEHPELTFLVTRIGCGIAGFTDEEIATLFKGAHDVDNIVMPPNC